MSENTRTDIPGIPSVLCAGASTENWVVKHGAAIIPSGPDGLSAARGVIKILPNLRCIADTYIERAIGQSNHW